MKRITLILISLIYLFFTGCTSTQQQQEYTFKKNDPFKEKNLKFLNKKKGHEDFRVLLSSDYYIVKQIRYKKTIRRVKDAGGDNYMSEEMKKLDKINEAREGAIKIWLYPDSGKIMKVRPVQPTYLIEIDKLITEDIQRWSFKFPKNYVYPTKLEIRYRVVLRQRMTDEQILQEMRKNMR